MRGATGSDRTIVPATILFFGLFHKVCNVIAVEACVDDQDVWTCCDQRNGSKIFEGVVAEGFLVEGWRSDERAIDCVKQCLTICRRARDKTRADIASCPWFIFNDDIVSEPFAKRGGECARQNIR